MSPDDKKEVRPHLEIVFDAEEDEEEEIYERMSVIDIVGTPEEPQVPKTPDSKAEEVQPYLSQWLLAFSTGDYDGAINAASEAVWIMPEDHSIRCKLATAFLMAGKYPQAAESLEYILTRDPDHAEAKSLADSREILAHLLREAREALKNRDFGGALIPVKRAIKFVPEFAEPYVLRAIIHYQHGRRSDCLKDLKQALDLEPNHEQAARLLAEIEK
jgi:Flp pilus assembly protein TadD